MRWGHNEEDVYFKYSIAKVHRYYNHIRKKESIEFFAGAQRIAAAVSYGQLPETKKQGQALEKGWKKYLSYIDPAVLDQKRKDKKQNPLTALFEKSDKVPLVEE